MSSVSAAQLSARLGASGNAMRPVALSKAKGVQLLNAARANAPRTWQQPHTSALMASSRQQAGPCRLPKQRLTTQRRPTVATQAVGDIIPLLADSPYRDAICFAVSTIGAIILVKTFDILATTGVIDQKLSRKLVHTTSGPLFVLTWPLFSMNPAAKFLAAAVPFLNFARLMLVGTGVLEDRGLVLSVSRSGERSELLKGPLYYCIVLICVAVLCWRDNPAGLIAISLMCGGDGLADIVGRRLGSVKLPYNSAKSWAGSIAMFLGGAGMSLGLIYYFCNLGFFSCYAADSLLPYVLGISLAATVAESLPINQVLDDNISVPVVSLVLASVLMEYLKV